MDPWTELVRFDACPGDPHRPTSTPIYQTATFERPDASCEGGYDYTRSGNPTRSVLEGQLARLEGAAHALAYASGMAALSGLVRILRAGDHVVAGTDLYGGTHRLLGQILPRLGVAVTHAPATDPVAFAAAIRPGTTKLALIETPSNPLQEVADIRRLAEIARAGGARLAVDNSLLSPWLQKPLAHGADVVVHSATKALCGHGDVTGGVLATNDAALAEELAFFRNAEGSALAPFESWLLLRGVKTLGLRVERQQETARRVATWLASRAASASASARRVARVHYVGLPHHPGRAIHERQAAGPGSVISFETGSVEASRALIAALELFTCAVSFGSITSTVSLPCAMSHASVPAGQRVLPEDIVRLSIGIESADDLIADLSSALASLPRARMAL